MSSSDPFLPVPPEEVADLARARDLEDVEDDAQPDVLPSSGGDSAEEIAAAADAAEPDRFRAPEAGDRLTAEELEDDLG